MHTINVTIFTYMLLTVLLLGGLLSACAGGLPSPTPSPVASGRLACPSDFCRPFQAAPWDGPACAGPTSRKLEDFRALSIEMTFAQVCARVGRPDWETGSGLFIVVYDLADGTRLLLGFAGFDRMMYANRLLPDGSSQPILPTPRP